MQTSLGGVDPLAQGDTPDVALMQTPSRGVNSQRLKLTPRDVENHILRLKCTKFNFGWGSAPEPVGGA